jgi:hypothetical protein
MARNLLAPLARKARLTRAAGSHGSKPSGRPVNGGSAAVYQRGETLHGLFQRFGLGLHFLSLATAAKPVPASHALAASTAAFRAKMFICNAISSMRRIEC